MIDRPALEQLAGRHLAAMQSPGGVSVLLHLHGGIFDRLVLPYGTIAYVTLTAREPENRSTIGFHTQWTGTKPS
jgi:hypothetical protein